MPQTVAESLGTIWSRAAIHDTVASIVRQRGYHRSLRESMLGRVWHWIAEHLDRLTRSIEAIPHGKSIALVAAVAIALLITARIAYATRLRDEARDRARRHRATRGAGRDPWRTAERLAAAGRFTEAAHELYRAVIGELAAHGAVRVHPSKTSGDYARELRKTGSPAHGPFRQFCRRYEQRIYGSLGLDAAGYADLLAATRPVVEPVGARAA